MMFDVDGTVWTITLLTYIHINSITYSLFVHRGKVHRYVTFIPAMEKIFDTIEWLTIGRLPNILTRIHIIHHIHSDRPGDPHSPVLGNKWEVMFKPPLMVYLQYLVSLIPFTKKTDYGKIIFLAWNVLLFGLHGIAITLVYMIILYSARPIIFDGFSHLIGYRNFNTQDNSRNLFPIGILLAGEELHNNHHWKPHRMNYRCKWYEFDIGYWYMRIMQFLRLCKIR